MLLNSCLLCIWQHFVSGWGPVKGGEEEQRLCLKIFSLLIYERFTIWNFLFTLEFQAPDSFFTLWGDENARSCFTLKCSDLTKIPIWSFFRFVITYHVLVSHILASYNLKSSKMLVTWISALLSAWYCQWTLEMEMMKGRQGRVSRAEHHLLAITVTKIKTWGAFRWG